LGEVRRGLGTLRLVALVELVAAAKKCGRRPVTTFCNMFTVPMTAWVGSPFEELRGAIAWYARKT
jgi:hypothetical protein